MATATKATVTVYLPDGEGSSCLQVWSNMIGELVACRELVWRLLWRDIAARYRQSILGYIWAVVPPMATAAVFSSLGRARVLVVGETSMPYPAYALLGLVIWQFFAGSVTAAAGSLIKGEALVTKLSFPREALVLASIGQQLFELPIRLLLVALMFGWFGIVPPPTVLLAPLLLVPLLLLSLGIGFMAAIANSLLRDLGESLPFVLLVAMLLTPVVYPPPTSWPWALLNELNPLSALIGSARDWATDGYLSRPYGLVAACLISLLIFLAGWRVFHLAESYIAERI